MNDYDRTNINPTGESRDSQSVKRWRSEFPYHWDADELVSRRQFFHLAVYASGALFGCTAMLALMGARARSDQENTMLLGPIKSFPKGKAHYFKYPGEDQAMLLHLPNGRFVAYSQKCTHLSCAVYYEPENQRIFCPCHDGVFSPDTGNPLAGPPQRRLPRIEIVRRGNKLYAIGEVV